MTRKDICKAYIEANLELWDKENALSIAFEGLSSDNTIVSIIAESYVGFVNDLFKLAVGESNQDWTDYWLYECEAKNETTINIDAKDYLVTNFDELWTLVGED